jgi:hypothetical protein
VDERGEKKGRVQAEMGVGETKEKRERRAISSSCDGEGHLGSSSRSFGWKTVPTVQRLGCLHFLPSVFPPSTF